MSKTTFLEPLIGSGPDTYELVNAERGSVLARHVEPAFDSKTRKKGLLGRESVPGDYALVIAPCNSIHTFFMRCPIDVVFVSRDGTVTKTCRGVKPWRIAGSLKAFAVVEAAQGFIARHDIVPGETVALREAAAGGGAANGQPVGAQAPATKLSETAARHGTSHKRVTLADIVASRTALAWFESVAVVQELCQAVEARGPAGDLRVPELKHIGLTAEGRVTLLAAGPGEHSPVQRAGLVLLALTPEEQLPVQLRLLILEAVSPRPRLKSIRELSHDLEFFERPDRQCRVQEVYERFQRQSAPGALEPPPPLEPPSPKRTRRSWNHRQVAAWVSIGLLVTAVAALAWAWPRPEGQRLRSAAAQMASAATRLARQGVDAARRELGGLGSRIGLTPDAQRPTAPPPAAPKRGRAVPAGRPPDVLADGQPTALQMPAGTLLPTEAAPGPGPSAASVPADSTGAAIPPPLADSQAGEVREEQPAIRVVYSAADLDVIPPRLVRPALPGPSATAGAEDSLEVEIVVSPAGDVESVKLLSGAGEPGAAMTLSAIKAWSFEPASRDGAPVAYRQRMKLPRR